MTKEEFEDNYKIYNPILEPIISQIIKEDNLYCQINETIRWGFGWDDNIAITATHDRKTNEIHMNILACIDALNQNRLFDIEYFLIHEMRHIFQNKIVEKYKEGIETDVDKELIERWIYEIDHYIKSLDQNGNENLEYFKQDIFPCIYRSLRRSSRPAAPSLPPRPPGRTGP